jgi:ribose transport system substrate-binding protein
VKRYTVNSVVRAAALLKSFPVATEATDLTSLARRTGLSKPTAFRILQSLIEAGLVERSGKAGYLTRVRFMETVFLRIGYGQLTESASFSTVVTEGLRNAATSANIDLLVLNNEFSASRALANADRFVSERVDLVIDAQIDMRIAAQVAAKFTDAGIPFIAIDLPHPGSTYFGADHYRAGRMAGKYLGAWAHRNWQGQTEQIVLIGTDIAGPVLNTRLTGMLDGLLEGRFVARSTPVLHLDTKAQFERTWEVMRKTLPKLRGKHILVGTINDPSALAALQAFRDLAREEDCAIASQDAGIDARIELRKPNSRLICSTAYFPESYGQQLIALALDILKKRPTPPAIFVEHKLITPLNVNKIYPYDAW